MVYKTLFALCILTAGWRVQSLPTSAPLSVSLPTNIVPPTTIWTSSPQNTDADTASPSNGTHNNSVLPVTASAPTSLLPKNISIESREEEITSPGSIAAITVTVIAVVLLVFGVAAYLKIRHSSYGRLLDDHDYGSWGNYNNPLYDDS
ncbi:DKFZP564O0823 protein, isoform CRA_c [Homo sapiens]|nr:DKFZP564O0823 protein, isoform CRA_c [Homo sapiens]